MKIIIASELMSNRVITTVAAILLIMIFLFLWLNARKNRKLVNDLQHSHNAMIESLALVVAMRDDETGEHLKRTKQYVKELAEYLYEQNAYSEILTRKHIYYMTQAVPLHDIGKVGIPDNILKKPGHYTAEEYAVMKQHPRLGKEVIEKVRAYYDHNIFLDVAYNIAYYHHERWDGTGYPKGLKADEIPLEAQLMALADVYDALVNKRCYKEAFSFEESEAIILDGRGTQFNPVIVDAFMALHKRFRDIVRTYRDGNPCYTNEDDLYSTGLFINHALTP